MTVPRRSLIANYIIPQIPQPPVPRPIRPTPQYDDAQTAAYIYTEPKRIWEALETGHVRLVRMSWLIALANTNGTLARRHPLGGTIPTPSGS